MVAVDVVGVVCVAVVGCFAVVCFSCPLTNRFVDSFWLLLDIMALFGPFVYLFLAGVDMLTVGYVDQRVPCDCELISMVDLTH